MTDINEDKNHEPHEPHKKRLLELVPKSVILSPALAVSQAKALRNRIFQGCSSKI
jgi:hypothetical protein